MTTGLTDEEVEQLKERLAPKSSPSTAAKRISSAPPPGEQGASGTPSRTGSVSSPVAQYKPDLSVGCTIIVYLVPHVQQAGGEKFPPPILCEYYVQFVIAKIVMVASSSMP